MALGNDLQIQLEIKAEVERARKDIASISDEVKKMGRTFDSESQRAVKSNSSMIGSLKRLVPIVAGAFAVDKIIGFGKELITTATELDQLQKKASTVLGDFEKDVRSVADDVSQSMGLTSNKFVGLTTNVADLLVPMGFARQEAANMSVEVIKLSGALSERTGGKKSAEQAADAMAKALLGEREMLKEFGIKISEADVQQKLFERGQKDLTGAMLEQAKAQITLELLYQRSQDAQTAFKEGGDSLIRTQNEMKATLATVKETLAVTLTPAINEAVTDILERTKVTLENEETQQQLVATVQNIAEAIKVAVPLVLDLIDALATAFNKAKSLFDFLTTKAPKLPFGPDFSYDLGKKLGEQIRGARAMGGPVSGGSPYLVGERGPELFVPKSSGNIVPNNKMGNTINISVNVSGGGDRNFAGYVVEEIKKSLTRDKQLAALGIA